jgi:hypothetical protein
MDILQKALEFILSAEGASVTIAIVLEFVFRMIPTQKPLSILHVVAKASHMIGQIFSALGKFLDRVLPQKLVEISKE